MPCNAFVAGLFFMGAFLLSQKPGFPPFRVLRAPFPVVVPKNFSSCPQCHFNHH
jgi:hypothetical protein